MPRIAYLDCLSGISGDMTLGALVDAGVSLERLNSAVTSCGLTGCRLVARTVSKHGYRATQVVVEHEPEHAHRHLSHILAMIDSGELAERQKELARAIFNRLAEAEAHVHGTTVEKVHFHEVGAVDSIADIVGSAVGFDLLGIETVVASPVPVGSGRIRIAHGPVNVPAPATAELLRGVPLAESTVEAELTTPTGAAILATLADSFGPLPSMRVEQIGYGAGQKDLSEQPNLLRLFVGETIEPGATGQVCLLETNLDDISGEMVGYCADRLWQAGALDVSTTAIQMKKGRPGVRLSVLCRPADAEVMEAIVFEETTTLGIRRSTVHRCVLPRQTHRVETVYGPVDGKVGFLADGTVRFAPEYESCRRIATERNVPLRAVYEAAQEAFRPDEVEHG